MRQPVSRYCRHCLLAACLAAAATSGSAQSSAPTQVVLGFQQSAPVGADEVRLQFVGYQDTRCPADVACAVAGHAQVFVWIEGPRLKGRVVALPWSAPLAEFDAKRALPAGGRQLQLLSLEPRPLMGKAMNAAEYKAVIAFRDVVPTRQSK